MVVDKFENLEKYASLNPLFAEAIKFLKTTDLNAQELGKIKLQGDDLVVNFSQTNPKTKEEAKLETHNRFIDIQIPLSGEEVMGYTPREDLPEAEYNADKDISFYHGLAESYIPVKPGMFVIFFPQDAHAPGVIFILVCTVLKEDGCSVNGHRMRKKSILLEISMVGKRMAIIGCIA